MGFVNNQWLKGRPERNRAHGPISAVISAENAGHQWDKDHGIVLQLRVTKNDGDYQHVLFTAQDLKQFLAFTLSSESASAVVTEFFAGLEDSRILSILKNILDARARTVAL